MQHVDVRIIAATNIQLIEKIARGEFRKDLFYRLSIVPLEIPPLRARREDIPLLLNHFMSSFASKHNLPPAHFAESMRSRLSAYPWPGNVRELRNLCERLPILLAGRTIEEKDLREGIAGRAMSQKSLFALPERGMDLYKFEIELIQQALDRTRGNRSRSARLLGISRDTLLYRMRKHSLT